MNKVVLLLVIVASFCLGTDALSGPRNPCTLGPGYWCSGDSAAAVRCGAVEYCRQLSLRQGGRQQPPPPPAALAAVVSDDNCDVCQQVLATIKQALLENKTQAEIGQIFKQQVCQKLGPLTIECEDATDLFLPQVLQTISMDIQPKLICQMLGLCNQTSPVLQHAVTATRPQGAKQREAVIKRMDKYSGHPLLMLMRLQSTLPSGRPLSAINCQLCKTLVAEARRLARDGKAEAEVAAVLRSACQLVPNADERAKCSSAVIQYTPIAFQLLSTELDPSIVCQALGSCLATTRQRPPAKVATPAAAGLSRCLLCELTVRRAAHVASASAAPATTAAGAEAALTAVCRDLPRPVQPGCRRFVARLGPSAARLLTNGLPAKRVCSTLGECKSQPPPAKWTLAFAERESAAAAAVNAEQRDVL